MNKISLLLLMSILMISSCAIDDDVKIDPCMDEFVGSFELLPSSLDVFPYLDFPEFGLVDTTPTKLIFVNESGAEIIYYAGFFIDRKTTSISIPKACHEIPEKEIRYGYEIETKGMSFLSDDNNMKFNLSLKVWPKHSDPAAGKVADVFSIFASDGWTTSFSVFDMLANNRDWEDIYEPVKYDSKEILNKEFTDVYKMDYTDSFSELYYSFDLGIVAFTDVDNVQWVLDRIE